MYNQYVDRENKVKKVFVTKSLSHRSETESLDSQVIVDISHKIMNEILNDPPQLQNQLDHVNKSITESSDLIKYKISQLLADNSSLKQHENHEKMVNQGDLLKQELKQIMEGQTHLEQKYTFIKNNLINLDREEREYQMSHIISICQNQEQSDKQQNESYDFYETEFNKLKENYDTLSLDQELQQKFKEDMRQSYSAVLESKAMLKEDLNGRLLQRAELVAQKEEQEELIDHFIKQDDTLLQFGEKKTLLMQQNIQITERLDEIESLLISYESSQEVSRAQASKHNQLQLMEAQFVQNTSKIKTNKNKLLSIQKSLNLPHPDTLFAECVGKYGSDVMKFMNNLRTTTMRQSGHKWSSANEYMALVEFYMQQSLLARTLMMKIQEIKSSLRYDNPRLQEDVNQSEYKQENLKVEMNQILEQQFHVKKDIQQLQVQFDIKIEQLTEQPFSHYLQENEDQIYTIRERYGDEECENMLQDQRQQFYEIIEHQETLKLTNVVRLMESFLYLEKVIKVNIDAVDDTILPDLKVTMQKIDEQKGQILLYDDECGEQEMKSVEQEIFSLEQEFRVKIQHFQENDEQLNSRLKDINKEKQQAIFQKDTLKDQMQQHQDQSQEKSQNLRSIEDCLNRDGFHHKSRLEQEIVDLNSTLMIHQHKKKKIEAVLNGIQFLQSPVRADNHKMVQSPATYSQISRRSSGNVMKDNRSPLSRSMNGSNLQKFVQKRQYGIENTRLGAVNQSAVPLISNTPGKIDTKTYSSTKSNRFWQSPNYNKR